MDEFRDLNRLTTIASAMLIIFLVSVIGTALLEAAVPSDPLKPGVTDLAIIVQALVTVICMGVVGRWIYVASRNAHLLRDDLEISPGWAVGWYFVPFANLVMPYRAMREIWLASAGKPANAETPTPATLMWWWGLWLTTNIVGSIVQRFNDLASLPGSGSGASINLVIAAVNAPLCYLLITIMRQISAGQVQQRYAEAFA